MGPIKDETGKRYGLLTVERLYGTNNKQGAIWLCKCDCGMEVAVYARDLRCHNTRSCGCLRRMPFDEREKLGFWPGGRRARDGR